MTDGAAKNVDHSVSSRFITSCRGADLETMRTRTSLPYVQAIINRLIFEGPYIMFSVLYLIGPIHPSAHRTRLLKSIDT